MKTPRILKNLYKLTQTDLTESPESGLKVEDVPKVGKIEHLSPFTEDEYDTYEHDEIHGWKKFKKTFGL